MLTKYLIPICDCSEIAECWIEVINANSYQDCQDKLMNRILELYDIDGIDYDEFLTNADENNIIIGKIVDIEEL